MLYIGITRNCLPMIQTVIWSSKNQFYNVNSVQLTILVHDAITDTIRKPNALCHQRGFSHCNKIIKYTILSAKTNIIQICKITFQPVCAHLYVSKLCLILMNYCLFGIFFYRLSFYYAHSIYVCVWTVIFRFGLTACSRKRNVRISFICRDFLTWLI